MCCPNIGTTLNQTLFLANKIFQTTNFQSLGPTLIQTYVVLEPQFNSGPTLGQRSYFTNESLNQLSFLTPRATTGLTSTQTLFSTNKFLRPISIFNIPAQRWPNVGKYAKPTPTLPTISQHLANVGKYAMPTPTLPTISQRWHNVPMLSGLVQCSKMESKSHSAYYK